MGGRLGPGRVSRGVTAHRRARGAVCRGGGQRAKVLVASSCAGLRRRRRLQRGAGPSRHPDHRLDRAARHHSRRAARRASAGASRCTGGSDGAAPHPPRRGPAPTAAPSVSRAGVRGREVARAARGRDPGLYWCDERGSVTPQSPAIRSFAPRLPRTATRLTPLEKFSSSPTTRVR